MSQGICFKVELSGARENNFQKTSRYICKPWSEVRGLDIDPENSKQTIIQIYTGSAMLDGEQDTISRGRGQFREQGREQMGLYRDEYRSSTESHSSYNDFGLLQGQMWRSFTEHTVELDCGEDAFPIDLPQRCREFTYYGKVRYSRNFDRPPI